MKFGVEKKKPHPWRLPSSLPSDSSLEDAPAELQELGEAESKKTELCKLLPSLLGGPGHNKP